MRKERAITSCYKYDEKKKNDIEKWSKRMKVIVVGTESILAILPCVSDLLMRAPPSMLFSHWANCYHTEAHRVLAEEHRFLVH